MSGKALGFIESVGLVSAITAADAALKAANVELIGRENSRGSGYITIKIIGDVGAVNAAINVAKGVTSNVARVWSTDVIPRPSDGLGQVMVWNKETQGADGWLDSKAGSPLAKAPAHEIVAVPEDIPKPAIIKDAKNKHEKAPDEAPAEDAGDHPGESASGVNKSAVVEPADETPQNSGDASGKPRKRRSSRRKPGGGNQK